jgi:hypothetical protein
MDPHMTISATTTPGHRAMVGLCLGATMALLSGCGSGPSAAPQQAVTVTTTPTVTLSAAPPTATATTTRKGNVKSDVVGRRFDLGTIVKVENEGGVPVIILDRWTARGVSDSELAANGVPVKVHSDAPFENLNSTVTYRVPVAEGATFLYAHCLAVDQPPSQKSSTLNDFARLKEPEKVVLLNLDPGGQAYKAQNDPAC